MDYSEALSLLEVSPQKLEKNRPSSCGTSLLKYLFEAVTIIMCFPVVNFTDDCVMSFALGWVPGFETTNESINAGIAGCKLMTSARIIFFFFNSYSKPYNKQLNNLDRSVVTGKSQTSAYRIDLPIARSTREGLGLRFSRNDLTLGF